MSATFATSRFNSIPVRMMSIEGQLWFVAKDVAQCLGYGQATIQKGITSLTSRLTGEQKQVITVQGEYGEYPLTGCSKIPRHLR